MAEALPPAPAVRVADAAAIEQAAGLLLAGRRVAFPTETVYGLGADADDPAAVRAIFAAKGRPADHPVIVHVADAAAIAAWAQPRGPEAARLAARFWPGPLTLVVPRSARAHDGLTGGQAAVGLRAPAHPVARALLAALVRRSRDPARALAAPSANRFGRISATCAAHVVDEFAALAGTDAAVDLVLDGGACPVGIESTIVDLSGPRPRLLRPGAIARATIESALGVPLEVPVADAGAPRAPGRLERHYAPRTRLVLVPVAGLAQAINARRGLKLGVLAPAAALVDRTRQIVARELAPADAAGYARGLYAALRRLDAAGADELLVALPPATADWDAIHDRLRRAAAGAGPAAAG